MKQDPSQQYLPAPAFVPYRRPGKVWQEFKAEWKRLHGAEPLPEIHNLVGMTGIHRDTLCRIIGGDPDCTHLRKQNRQTG